jgi:hypothetical protein
MTGCGAARLGANGTTPHGENGKKSWKDIDCNPYGGVAVRPRTLEEMA